MKVKMLVSRSGADGAFAPGDVIDVPADEGQRMIKAGQCELVRSRKVERAVAVPAFETAVDETDLV
jgi:hypothetical protein